ncbi:hypothetical protein F0919_14515 [Taibaiella lutea]|uniref:Uncharacterized protein n=1 Tax=Taibaiella lutea TaxID=2608001 RepID=A0A5M6CIG7_9BACT|nr:hypothetical protein [Taibaiella lutea]KAA5533742.1 hypothetical protein F0919_14515 [Taibaiella lutea]
MSVHLMLTKTHNGEEINVPIATESFFSRVWRPLAEKHSLFYVVEMQSGYDIEQKELIKITEELKVMQTHVMPSHELTNNEKEFLSERIAHVLNRLEKETQYSDVKGWVA